ncbi:hypothetical protein CALCODRAFT_487998 [Calocera cornea HHB12733]|uniref:GDP-fucose protein O-fucosyltransferase 2 n=1 Tax=Calocera cornea HHB12733 TaxID=1353952 RepID=A0A165CSX0_9BASI|nr:hypothetical protein CALCODRAFT_487998 [Calocera cornea HHB12733]
MSGHRSSPSKDPATKNGGGFSLLPTMGSMPSTPLPPYSEVAAPYESGTGYFPSRGNRRARILRYGLLAACLGGLVMLFSRLDGWEDAARLAAQSRWLRGPSEVRVFNVHDYVKGPPTPLFRDNLKDNVKYITTWVAGGWTNDVIAVTHLLFLAHLSGRVPVLPRFTPTHFPKSAGTMRFSDIFDIPRLERALNMPILEWDDIKIAHENVSYVPREDLGCWSSWMAGGEENNQPRDTENPKLLGLNVQYTPVPRGNKMYGAGDWHLLFGRLLQLAYPSGRAAALNEVKPLKKLTPDEHMVCFDWLYYTGLDRSFEWEYDYSPEWQLVAKYMRWNPKLEAVADQYLRRHFGVSAGDVIPPFISVHARRDDFADGCPGRNASCLPKYDQLKERIYEVQFELWKYNTTQVEHVLVMSDEKDATWWAGINENGWSWIDHKKEDTAEKHGLWYEMLLDVVFHSKGSGFVGTDGSTMSLLAERRVKDWNGGQTARLLWHGL